MAYFDGSKGGGPYGFFGAGGGTLTALFWADDLDILFFQNITIFVLRLISKFDIPNIETEK